MPNIAVCKAAQTWLDNLQLPDGSWITIFTKYNSLFLSGSSIIN